MAKKKQPKNTGHKAAPKSFLEVVGIKQILDSDIFGFVFGVLFVAMAVCLTISMFSFASTAQQDQAILLDMRPGEWLNTEGQFSNTCGSAGAIASYFLMSRCFGYSAFIIPFFLLLLGLKTTHAYEKLNMMKWFFSLAIIMIWVSVLSALAFTDMFPDAVFNPGGDHGLYMCQVTTGVIGTPGLVALIILSALLYLTYLSTETINVVRKILNPTSLVSDKINFVVNAIGKRYGSNVPTVVASNEFEFVDPSEADVLNPYNESPSQAIDLTSGIPDETPAETPADSGDGIRFTAEDTGIGNTEKATEAEAPEEQDFTITQAASEEGAHGKTVGGSTDIDTPINPLEPFTRYKYPTISLLKKYDGDSKPYLDKEELTQNKDRIVEVLRNFGVEIRTITATVGPTITLYEITPAEGVRISKIRNLEDDIALSLAALGIRIIAPIPGKGTIGIEVPNSKPNIVSMESILNSRKFQETQMALPIALGKTITNEVFMVDLAKIPHLLVAGATGQGKSVGLNAIITSLLYKRHPNELKLVLIDPKKVEFSVYAPIANHFMATVPGENGQEEEPIITDVTKVIRTLNSLCKLMDTRYDLLKKAAARNIKEYNQKFLSRKLKLTDGHDYMPYIVVIIDEFGDLIMTAGKEIELPIARIAQLARAVGIHMVIATQRPTTSIITGNIKANFPGRMAFKVSSMIDSRTILDRPGANQLIGRGDMLFLNGNEPVRVQCAFVDTPEVEDINNYICNQPGPVEPMELPEPLTDEGGSGAGGGSIDTHTLDPLFEEAAHAIVISQSGSTSMIQRRFSIGYNRAGRLMDQLEEAGIVGVAQGSKPREVLITDAASLEAHLAALHGA